ncbi:hypothetical protein KFK09_006527 [Dendrobium nobile]|uniref:Uncharacterized protein n=1 Tax=Dendrobium nobile TaxID=94219 RepID=A0A8T3BTT2_DENNO|nr:hypothetical protein KFK09_006527 [Dendrobium nobile]
MEDNKSFPEEEISSRKETAQPAEVTGNGSINGDSGSPSSPSKNLEVLVKESPGAKDQENEEDMPESTNWLLTGWGVHYGCRD